MRHYHSCCVGLLLLLGLLTACNPGRPMTAPGGQLYVSSEPSGATIICDGRPAADLTPATLSALAEGEHLLIIRKSGFLESRATVTVPADGRASLDCKLEPLRGLVLIHSTPTGAEVEIDNVHYGKTPQLITDFPMGQRRIKLSAPEHMPKTVELTVTDRTPQWLRVDLTSDSAWIALASQPAGASVSINGAFMGQTPCEVQRLPAGKHRLEIALQGYELYQEELTVQPGDERSVEVKLVPLPGKLTVLSRPPGARLYINDQFMHETPFATDSIAAGQYSLRAELQGYATQISNKLIRAGEETVLEFMLTKNSGTLLISTEPPGVTVYLDGATQGTTAQHGQDPLSEQLTINYVPQGAHKLQLTKPGYIDLTGELTIAPNQTMILHKKLTARPVPFVPNTILRTGPGVEHVFRGIIREKSDNGDIKLELERGIFKTFKAAEIQSVEPLPSP